MFKGKTKTRLVLDGKMYQAGKEVVLTKEQFDLLGIYLKNVTEVKEQKESVKAKKPSTRGKAKKATE